MSWRSEEPNREAFSALMGAQRIANVFSGIGDGVTDDSAKWNSFIASCITLGIRGIIPPGNYFIPNASAFSINSDLTLLGDGDNPPVLDGGKTAANYLFRITNKSLRIRDVVFKNFFDVISASDGSGGSMPNSLTGAVDTISLRRVNFLNCRRPVFAYVSASGPSLREFEAINCTVDGQSTGWAGFYCAWTNMSKAKANGNVIRNIDATAAGYGGGGSGAPANIGNGRAILLGGNNPGTTYAFERWEANDNIIENITDSRSKQAGSNPEVGGIRLTGGDYSTICRNKFGNIKSVGVGVDDDCEPIYPKSRFTLISENIIKDGGINGAAIIIKGLNRAGNGDTGDGAAYGYSGICSNNIIINTTGLRCSGIAVYSSDWKITGNHVEGCGGDTTRYAPIWVNAAQNDNTEICDNYIKGAIGPFGILHTGYGVNNRIERNIIDGVIATLTGLAAQTVVGIYILNANGNGFNIGSLPLIDCTIFQNKIGGLVQMTGQQTRCIMVSGSGSPVSRIRIEKNIVTTSMDVAVAIVGGTVSGITINDNDWSSVSDDYLTTGSPTVTDISARGNAGWLYSEISFNAPSIAPGTVVTIGTASISDCATRDRVFVTSSSDILGGILWGTVTATGTVTVYLFNPTTTAIDPVNSTYRIRVEKFAT